LKIFVGWCPHLDIKPQASDLVENVAFRMGKRGAMAVELRDLRIKRKEMWTMMKPFFL